MKLDDCPVQVFGDQSFRGRCPTESVEQMSFFNKLRKKYPDTYGLIAIHPRNEGLKSGGQFSAVHRHRAEGMTKGAADIIIPGSPAFVCELKRRDHTKSKWQDGQKEYLAACREVGCFSCVALGAGAAWEAFCRWRQIRA